VDRAGPPYPQLVFAGLRHPIFVALACLGVVGSAAFAGGCSWCSLIAHCDGQAPEGDGPETAEDPMASMPCHGPAKPAKHAKAESDGSSHEPGYHAPSSCDCEDSVLPFVGDLAQESFEPSQPPRLLATPSQLRHARERPPRSLPLVARQSRGPPVTKTIVLLL